MYEPDRRLSLDAPNATIFPKIEGKTSALLHAMKELKGNGKLPPVVAMEGTVKLHGIHADIIFDLTHLDPNQHDNQINLHPDNTVEYKQEVLFPGLEGVTFQSRNRVCAPNEASYGWPQELSRKPAALTYLRDKILSRFRELNPKTALLYSKPMIIAGEWVGCGVQRHVGLEHLDRGFVILSININGTWQKDAEYAMIEANKASIYSIYNVTPYTIPFDTSDLSAMNPAFFEMQELADDVEFACPFAARFGFPSTRGEGIVWKLGTKEGRENPRCWVKTKGPLSAGSARLTRENALAKMEVDVKWEGFVEDLITERRVEQGFEYLLEMGTAEVRQGQKVFCEWMVKDLLEEEKDVTEQLMAVEGEDAIRILKSKVLRRAYDVYYEKMKSPD